MEISGAPGSILAGSGLAEVLRCTSALSCDAERIATRSVRDFQGSPVPARTPAELLEELG